MIKSFSFRRLSARGRDPFSQKKALKMPSVHDEEESLCLLAADLQDLPQREMIPNANTNW